MNPSRVASKKAELDGFREKGSGLPSELVRNLEDWSRVDLTYTSNAIEGNTLTRQETALVVEKGLTVGGKTLTEHLEATNHARAIDRIHKIAERESKKVTEADVLVIHEVILKVIQMANGETTSKNFDKRPMGFRMYVDRRGAREDQSRIRKTRWRDPKKVVRQGKPPRRFSFRDGA